MIKENLVPDCQKDLDIEYGNTSWRALEFLDCWRCSSSVLFLF